MVKKLFLALALAAPALGFAQAKIAVVDTEAIVAAMPETQQAEEQIKTLSAAYEQEYNRLTDEINKKVQEYQSLPPSTPAAIRERRQKEVQELDQRYQAFLQYAQEDIVNQRDTLMAPIRQKVADAVAALGAGQGYDIILPAAGALYLGPNVTDATEQIKAALVPATEQPEQQE